MQTLLAWIVFAIMLVGGVGWAGWLLRRASPTSMISVLTLITGLALSIGGLTLLMFWEALLGIRFTILGIGIPYFGLMLPGWFLWSFSHPQQLNGWRINWRTIRTQREQLSSVAIISIISGAILFNAAYWPFSRDDTLGIYDFYGQQMTINRTLTPLIGEDSLYRTYPMAVPLSYTFAYLLSGWHNEYLARVVPAVLSLATIPAVYVLGAILFGQRAGWISSVLLALTPTFASWASVGYVDLPMAFFYTMSAIFAWRVWQNGDRLDALLAGLMMGLAAWTKNAALIGFVFLGAWLIWTGLHRRITIIAGLWAISFAGMIAAPWYIRNLIGAGFLIPSTVWTEQAQQSLENLLIFVTRPQNFSVTGWFIMIGVVAAGYHLLKRRLIAPEQALLLLWTLPFFMVWWLYVSYDPRFLLMFLPLLIVLAAAWNVQMWTQIPAFWQQRLRIPIIIIVVILAAQVTWDSVEFKDEIFRDPLMNDATKHAIVLSKR